MFFFFFKQKAAYELRISDWSSDVCSSDLRRWRRWRNSRLHADRRRGRRDTDRRRRSDRRRRRSVLLLGRRRHLLFRGWRFFDIQGGDRKSVGEGKRVSVSVDLGGARLLKKKKYGHHTYINVYNNQI